MRVDNLRNIQFQLRFEENPDILQRKHIPQSLMPVRMFRKNPVYFPKSKLRTELTVRHPAQPLRNHATHIQKVKPRYLIPENNDLIAGLRAQVLTYFRFPVNHNDTWQLISMVDD
ncbi:MAG: hypothetical protein JJU35_15235 [Balneolales bacterium]|nr:hypothetical protein [Balneolales bacterium]